MYISKSNFICGCQCHKRLWLTKYKPELRHIDAGTENRFEAGTLVGEYARELFPGGTLIEYNKEKIAAMAVHTRNEIERGTKVIYESAFVYGKLIAICDILMVTPEGFEIYEVKSSTSCKDVYLYDLSFQRYVVEKCGYTVSKASIVYINKSYVRQDALDCKSLFTVEDRTADTAKLLIKVDKSIPCMQEMLVGNMPDIAVGPHCDVPYTCDYRHICFCDLPKNSIFDLYRIRREAAFDYYKKGIVRIADLKGMNNVSITGIQKLQLDTINSEEGAIDSAGIKSFFSGIKYPLYFLDFEAYQEAIPAFNNCNPYDQIPFQYSLHHIETENGLLMHKEFLANGEGDPRRELAERLCSDIGSTGTVLAYNMSFEKGIIAGLADLYADLRDKLLVIASNLCDLLTPFKKGFYYKREMHGSFSIKSVLPALFPNDAELDYKASEIQNGSEAMAAFPALMKLTETERLKLRNALLAYCKLDTFAMVKILNKLKEESEIS